MRQSFRLKIALLTFTLSGLMLLGFTVFAVSVLKRVSVGRIDQELRALVGTQIRVLQPDIFWQRFDESLRSFFKENESKHFVVKATDLNKRVLYATSNWPEAFNSNDLPISLESAQKNIFAKPKDWDEIDREKFFGKNPPPFRHATYVCGPSYLTIGKKGSQWRAMSIANDEIILSIAMDMTGAKAEISRFLKSLLLGVSVGLFLVAVAGWMIGHFALRPVNQIARIAEAITAHSLNERIPSENADEEFKRLIAVINGMLGRLERSFQQATRFSADAAHELKTPLAILQAQLERSLQQASDASSEQYEYAEQLDEVQRLRSILSKLLLLSQADAGKLPLSLDSIDLVKIASTAAEDAEMLAPNRTITLNVPSELFVQGDEVLLSQVVENLITNAVKFGDENGTIDIGIEEKAGQAVLNVTNSGSTISQEDSKKIFKRFYRADQSRSREIEGTGLGLSLAREIAKAHRGNLALLSSKGNMTCFALTLPHQKQIG